MKKAKEFLVKNWYLIVAFLIPWIVGIVHSLATGTWVVGNGSFFRGDMALQNVPFYYELWDQVHSGRSIFYSWDMAGGYDLWTQTLYMAMTPFTFLVLIFPRNCIENLLNIMLLMNWACIAASSTYFFYQTRHNKLDKNKELVALFLGTGFALSNGLINLLNYTQWAMVYILLPFVLLAIEKLTQYGNWKKYVLLLTLLIISNYYMGYHICLFLIIMFFMQMDSEVQNKKKRFFQFAGSSLLAVMISMFAILPSVMASSDRMAGSAAERTKQFASMILIRLTDFFEQYMIFQTMEGTASLKPNVYISLIGVFFALFLVFISISKKRKIYMCGVTLLLAASFFFGGLNIVWHGFTVPNMIFNRFVDVFIFWMLFVLLYVLQHMEDLKVWNVACVSGFVIVAAVFTFINIQVYESYMVYLITFMLLVLYIMIAMLGSKGSIVPHKLVVTICVFGMLELFLNAYHLFAEYETEVFMTDDYMTPSVELASEVSLDDGERMLFAQSISNMGMVVDKASVGGFSSYLNEGRCSLYKKLGMGSYGNVNLRGPSPLINLMYNVKYSVAQYDASVSDSTKISQNNTFSLYQTNRLAGLGYMVNSDILSLELDDVLVFENQNRLVEKMTEQGDIFEYIYPNLKSVNNYGLEKECIQMESYKGVYYVPYQKADEYIGTFFTAEEDMDLYIFFRDENASFTAININGENTFVDFEVSDQQTIHVGNVKKGDQISLVVAIRQGALIAEDANFNIQYAKFNEENYAKAYDCLVQNVYDIEEMTNDSISGRIQVDNSGVMMTSVPAEKGMKVLVDGEEVDYNAIGGSLIGVELGKGEHQVEFVYNTPYACLAWAISGVGVLVLLGFTFVSGKQKQK